MPVALRSKALLKFKKACGWELAAGLQSFPYSTLNNRSAALRTASQVKSRKLEVGSGKRSELSERNWG